MTSALPPLRTDPFSALPRPDRHKPKCGPVRPSKVGRRRAFVLIGVHVLILGHVLHWFVTGSTLSPVEPSEAMQTFELGYINAGFVLFVGLILSTLLFGRWFCGWGCHVVALQDLCAWILARLGQKPRPVRSRLLVFAPFVVAFHMFVWPHVEHWLDPAQKPMVAVADWQWRLSTGAFWATFPGWIMAIATFVFVGFLIVYWLGAKGFCSFGCPYGAFFAVADRFSPMRIKVTDACDACGHCTHVCTSNVRVHEEVAMHGQIVDPGCMKCFDCVSVCPKEALHFGLGKPAPLAISQQRRQARADLSWPEELAAGAVFFLAAQGFRGAWFGERVPFLLSVALGAITAVFFVVAMRLFRRPDVVFQHAELKRKGRLLPRGRLMAGLLAVWALLALDTGVVRLLRQRAEDLAVAVAPWSQPEARRSGLAELDAALGKAEAFSLLVDPEIWRKRGLLLRDLSMLEQDASLLQRSQAEFEKALRVLPDSLGVLVPLADVLHVQGMDAAAVELLQHAARVQPGSPDVQQRLQALQGPR